MSCIGIHDAIDGNVYFELYNGDNTSPDVEMLSDLALTALTGYYGRDDPEILFRGLIRALNEADIFHNICLESSDYPCVVMNTTIRRIWLEPTARKRYPRIAFSDFLQGVELPTSGPSKR